MEAEPVQFLWRHYDERLQSTRSVLADFLGVDAKDLVPVTNATAGVNAVVRSLRLRSGDELLSTDHAYNACQNVLVEAVRRARAKVVVARIPFPSRGPEEALDAILRGVTPRTRLALIDHVTSPTALILPVAGIIRALQERGVDALVDGAHAPGMVPLDISALNPAYYTGNLHKWVCAPKGAGFLWAREDKQDGLQPAVVSHGNNTSRPRFTPFQDRFDWAGTFDPTAWLCVGEAIHWMGKLVRDGWSGLQKRNQHLAVQARKRLCQRLRLAPPCPEEMLGSMATLPLPESLRGRPKSGKIDAEQLRLYDEFRIEVPFLRFGPEERRWFRISAQIYNSVDEYDYLAEALEQMRGMP
jgi:isopenicillin-N epimerase